MPTVKIGADVSGSPDVLAGELNDWLYGGGGAALPGGAGDDMMTGGGYLCKISLSGMPVFSADRRLFGNDSRLIYGSKGDDSLEGSDSRNMFIAFGGDDVIKAYGGRDTVYGGEGKDTIFGGSGDDLIYGDDGSDSLYGGDGRDTLRGGDGKDNIYGDDGNDLLYGGSGNDTLQGGRGADAMSGGTGDDVYYVGHADDVVTEKRGEGTDIIYGSVSCTLGGNVENLTLTGVSAIDGTGNELDNVLTGNGAENTLNGQDGNDIIYGLEGSDTIYGGLGDDRLLGGDGDDSLYGGEGNDYLSGGTGKNLMCGGDGDDIYEVDEETDVIVEYAGEGIDIVKSKVTCALTGNVENLILVGTDAIDGKGNTESNVLTGNSAKNILDGGGSDTLIGGMGDDTYHVDNESDVVIENAGEGMDIVCSSVSYSLSADVENLTLTGASAIDGTGNDLANLISGNDSNNVLNGLGGSDTLNGYGGNDILDGGWGADTLDGGLGADMMIGGRGDDTYHVDHERDAIKEHEHEGTDTVYSSVSYVLSSHVENLILTGASASNGTGNDLANLISGNGSDNVLYGLGGSDTLIGGGGDILAGGKGSDTYIFGRTDGKDAITDTGLAGDEDVIKMTDLLREEPVIVRQDSDLYIFVDMENYIKVTNQLNPGNPNSDGIERLEVSDGYYITRSDIMNIVNTMSAINSDPGMDVLQKYNAMLNDPLYAAALAQSWHQA